MPTEPYYRGPDSRAVIYLGDSREAPWRAEGVEVDHVITDPPYTPLTHASAKTSRGGKVVKLIDFEPMDLPVIRRVLVEAAPRRWVIATVDNIHAGALLSEPPSGLKGVRFGAWVKPSYTPQMTGDRPAQGWEAVAILHRAGVRTRWNGGGRSAVWTCNPEKAGHHSTGKPIALLSAFLADFTDSGEVVLDPFAGSGSTAVAAARLGRRSVSVELDERHAETAARRLDRVFAQGTLPFEATPPARAQSLLLPGIDSDSAQSRSKNPSPDPSNPESAGS